MDKKIRLGLNLFFNNSTNSGIVNYIYNIVCALKTLPENERPSIIVFYTTDSPIDYIRAIEYTDIKFVFFTQYSSSRIVNGLTNFFYKLTKKNFYIWYRYYKKIDVLYPYFEFMDKPFEKFKHKVHWLVDFNNRACSAFYPDGGKGMTEFQGALTNRTDHIVLSSNSLLKELELYYPNYKNKVSILRFACSLPKLDEIYIGNLKDKYDLRRDYLMSPNQFWEHKNQLLLIEALHILKQQNKINFDLIFTGSMTVTRGKGQILEKLVEKVEEYNLSEHVRFLGIIDRTDQLVLMKSAKALIQPSLYEGWSTLVEEAKALNQQIILSDLPVHREQDCKNSYFFNPASAEQLAETIASVYVQVGMIKKIDYSYNVFQFGKDIKKMLLHEVS